MPLLSFHCLIGIFLRHIWIFHANSKVVFSSLPKYLKNLTLYLTLNKAWSRSRFGVSKLQLRLPLRPSQKPTTPTSTPAFQKPTTPATPTPTPTPTPQPWCVPYVICVITVFSLVSAPFLLAPPTTFARFC